MTQERVKSFIVEIEKICADHGVVLDIEILYDNPIQVKVRNYCHDPKLNIVSWRDYWREKKNKPE